MEFSGAGGRRCKAPRESGREASRQSSLPKTVPGWEMQVRDAQEMLETGTRAGTADAIRLLDGAVGLRAGRGGYRGVTLSAHAGMRCLPIYLVRRVEYESAARRLNLSEMEIGRLHAPFGEAWYFGDVRDAERASEYLMRATLGGNRFAKRVLDWLSPERGRGIDTTKGAGREEYLRAIRDGERERAVELGRMVCGGVGAQAMARPDATVMLRMGGVEQKAMAANNIGYLLAHGAGGVDKRVGEAVEYYEMAIRWGSAAAASNLGLLVYSGADGVRRDGRRAQRLYETAIERGERNYAPRNLGVLLHHGAPGVKADVAGAARMLLLGLREGDDAARAKCRRSLKIVMRSWRMRFAPGSLREECAAALRSTAGVAGGAAALRSTAGGAGGAASIGPERRGPYGM